MERLAQAAIRCFHDAAAFDPTTDSAHLEAASWFDLNIDLRSLDRYDGAEQAVRTALRLWRHLSERYPAEARFRSWLGGAWNNLGILCADTGRSEAAEAAYLTALEVREETARAAPDNAENQLFLGGALCNLGNVYRDRGDMTTARDYYRRAIRTIDAVADRLAGNALVNQFMQNSRDGLAQAQSRPDLDSHRFASATVACSLPGPPALELAVGDANLAAAVRRIDELRRAGDPGAEQASAELVSTVPDCAEAWLLRGLVLGYFTTEQGGATLRWEDNRHLAATEAFYEALVCRPDYYEAKLYKGLALRHAAHAAQAGLRALQGATESLPEQEREAYLAPKRQRFRWDVARARESLEAAARLRPGEGRPWYELADLYNGLGYREEARPYLERLRAVDPGWYERVRGEFEPVQE
jgi:tetratricopeptide (TPR) repeat protein